MRNVRAATTDDAESIGRLMHRFNTEFGEPTPGPDRLAARLGELIESGETVVLLAGEGPEGLLVVRFRPALWSSGQEAYIAELYVKPESRRRGFGGELMAATLELARERGSDWIHLGTDEGDAAPTGSTSASASAACVTPHPRAPSASGCSSSNGSSELQAPQPPRGRGVITPTMLSSGSVKCPMISIPSISSGPKMRVPPRLSALVSAASTSSTAT